MSNHAAEAIANLFEPDVLLPSQFNSCVENGIEGGERKLMAAILSDGIEAYIAQHAAGTVGATKSPGAWRSDPYSWCPPTFAKRYY